MSQVEEASPSENGTQEKRKSMKPIMEKRRRARINSSLDDLKTLILEAMKKDTSCFTKLEKADILAMTVQYLKSVKQQQINSPTRSSDSGAMANYCAGYNECAAEATRFLMNCQGLDPQVRTRILSHLALCCQTVRATTETETRPTQSTYANTTPQYTPILPPLVSTTTHLRTSSASVAAADQYSPLLSSLNSTQLRGHVRSPHENVSSFGSVHYQILPGTLPNGRLAAVLLPAENINAATSVAAPTFPPQYIPLYHSAGLAEASTDERQRQQGLQVQSGMAFKVGSDPLWRPF